MTVVVLWACAVCFQIQDGATSVSLRAAVLVLMGVTAGVLSGFALFIARFVRRSRRLAAPGRLADTGAP